MSNPGPNSKTNTPANTLGPIPGPPVNIGDDVALEQLTADQIRARLAARERDLKYHVAALKHEAATVLDDVVVDGRPLMDRIRERPAVALGIAAATGAVVGSLFGLRARAKRRAPVPEDHIEFIRARLATALDEAAAKVARGTSVEDAMQSSMSSVPAVFGDSRAPESYHTARQGAFDVAFKSALGFGLKAVVDYLIRRFTDSDGTVDALTDAAD